MSLEISFCLYLKVFHLSFDKKVKFVHIYIPLKLEKSAHQRMLFWSRDCCKISELAKNWANYKKSTIFYPIKLIFRQFYQLTSFIIIVLKLWIFSNSLFFSKSTFLQLSLVWMQHLEKRRVRSCLNSRVMRPNKNIPSRSSTITTTLLRCSTYYDTIK